MTKLSLAISSDNSVAVANRRALDASAELRAKRDELHAQVRAIQCEIHAITKQINAVEKAAYRGN